MERSGQQTFEQLRKDYPFFTYEGFRTEVQADYFQVEYSFDMSGKHKFAPSFKIPFKTGMRKQFTQSFLESSGVQSLLFHIGLIELISYWKTACPPLVIIKGHRLNNREEAFWRKTYYHGLGEFFHTNGIKTTITDFMSFQSSGETLKPEPFQLEDSIIVPIGGGKDSVVSLELLKDKFEVRPFILNPRGASLETCYKAGYSGNMILEINRRLDPHLLELNAEGYLNGHTPFSAMLAFYTLLMSAVTGFRHIALSNESSANEPTVAGTDVNHQYSKSSEFEKDFREYVRESISADFNYFSFLRPLSELQIAMLFARNVKYYPVFKSCNVGSKTDIWCGHCPKCLFAWIILCPFIPVNELEMIFGRNLFEDASLIPFLKELTGLEESKPFECVGTIDEVNIALQMFIKQHSAEKWPVLVDYYSNTSYYSMYRTNIQEDSLTDFNEENFLEERFASILKEAIGCKQ